MIRWCPSCHRYLGEKPPLDDYSFAPEPCATCAGASPSARAKDARRADELGRFFARVSHAGKPGVDAAALVREGQAMGIEPLDLLVGMIQPALYLMGQRWACEKAAVWEEHRLTAACESILHLLVQQQPELERYRGARDPQVLLVNAEGNYHTLGIQMVEYFLASQHFPVMTLFPGLPDDEVVALVRSLQPQALGVSCALPLHLQAAGRLAEAVARLPPAVRPIVAVGGRAVHAGVEVPARVCTSLTDFGLLLG